MVRRLAHCAGVIIAVVEDDGVASAAVDIHSAGESLGVPPVGKGLLSTLQENGTLFECPYVLSRACLGKMIIFRF